MRWFAFAFILWVALASKAGADIKNPSAFIGQIINGGVDGDVLVVSAGKINQIPQSAIALTNTELNGSAFSCTTTTQNMTGMTVTPVAGSYLAIYSSDFNAPNAGQVVTLQYAVGGTAQPNSVRKFMPFSGGTLTSGSQRIYAGLNDIIFFNGAQTLTVQCATSSGTVTTGLMTLDLVRVQ